MHSFVSTNPASTVAKPFSVFGQARQIIEFNQRQLWHILPHAHLSPGPSCIKGLIDWMDLVGAHPRNGSITASPVL
jgi:hypothetical protein